MFNRREEGVALSPMQSEIPMGLRVNRIVCNCSTAVSDVNDFLQIVRHRTSASLKVLVFCCFVKLTSALQIGVLAHSLAPLYSGSPTSSATLFLSFSSC